MIHTYTSAIRYHSYLDKFQLVVTNHLETFLWLQVMIFATYQILKNLHVAIFMFACLLEISIVF